MSTTPTQFLDSYLAAVNSADPVALNALYTADARVFDAMSAWQYQGNAWRLQVDQWLGMVAPGGRSVAEDVEVVDGGDVAVIHATVTYAGQLLDGPYASVSVRLTLGITRADLGWKIVHEHSSMPVTCDEQQRAIPYDKA